MLLNLGEYILAAHKTFLLSYICLLHRVDFLPLASMFIVRKAMLIYSVIVGEHFSLCCRTPWRQRQR